MKHTFPLEKRKYTFSKSRDIRLSFGGSRCVTEHLETTSSSRGYQRHAWDRGKKPYPNDNLLKGHPSSKQSLDFWRSLGPTDKIPLLILPRQRTQICKRALSFIINCRGKSLVLIVAEVSDETPFNFSKAFLSCRFFKFLNFFNTFF